MANTILNEVINGNVLWDDFVQWLNPKGFSTQGSCADVDCCQGDFVVYFINFLHDEVSSFLQNLCKGNTTLKNNSSAADHHSPRTAYGTRQNVCTSDTLPVADSVTSTARVAENSRLRDSLPNKSLDSYLSPTKSQHTAYGVKSNNILVKTSPKVINSPALVPIHCVERTPELTFINNCHLSPIVNEIHTCRAEKHVAALSETDSPGPKLAQNDARGSSATEMERATSSPCASSFNIENHAFPSLSSSMKSRSSRRRRIKPTRLVNSFEKGNSTAPIAASSFGEIIRSAEPNTSFIDSGSLIEKKENSVFDFRDLLRLEKQKLQQNTSVTITHKSPQVSAMVIPSPNSVNCKDELLLFAKMYSLLLDSNLVCNIISEIHFIFSLLNVQETCESSIGESSDNSCSKYFVSVHECVYFAAAVLNQQRLFISTLDRASLKLLADNKRISAFTPALNLHLQELYELRRATSNSLSTASGFLNTVCFQSDTDNRHNFPTDRAFATFRKQRDAFYELLGAWQESHSLPGWSFAVALGARVRSLLAMNDDPANFIHFARLFKAQLLGSCRKCSNVVEEESRNSLTEVIKCLKEDNPDKYSRLYERLVTPLKSSNPCASPEFPGQQEFYKDFIVSACHAVFNSHLMDCLWCEILLLDSSTFTASEVEDKDTSVDKDTKYAFLVCLNNLQLLAKFLGFVRYLPYRSKNVIPKLQMEKQSSLRIENHPIVDVFSCLQRAIQCKKVLLTVPWVVQYLSMVDRVSYTTPYYRNVLSFLFSIYRMYHLNSSYGSFLLKMCLGWLFEVPQLPEECFYSLCLNESQYNNFFNNCDDSHGVTLSIDELDLLDWNYLHELCPFLENVKHLLMSDSNHVNNVVAPRHITPVLVATKQLGSSSSYQRHIELKLEENFLENHPQSIRQTIEFVAERIASSCVKYICCKPLGDIKERTFKLIHSTLDGNGKEVADDSVIVDPSLLSHEIKVFCQDFVPKFCLNKCNGVMPLLVAEDVPAVVTQMSIKIAVRLSVEKVNLWINSHITPALFAKDINAETDRILRNSLKTAKTSHVLLTGWRDVTLKDSDSPSESIAAMRKLTWSVMGNIHIEERDVLQVVDSVLCTLQSRKDLIPSAERILGALSIDLALILVTHLPDLMNIQVLNKLLLVWKTPEVSSSKCFQNLISPRNMMILKHSRQGSKTWSAMSNFLSFALLNNLVAPSEFETQSVALFQQEWPMDLLKHLSSCFEDVIKIYLSKSCTTDNNFVLLLELLSDLCREMNDEEF